jgi:hypothetical protein
MKKSFANGFLTFPAVLLMFSPFYEDTYKASMSILVVGDFNNINVDDAQMKVKVWAKLKEMRTKGVFKNVTNFSDNFIAYNYAVEKFKEECMKLQISENSLPFLGIVEIDEEGIPVKVLWSVWIDDPDTAISALKVELGISTVKVSPEELEFLNESLLVAIFYDRLPEIKRFFSRGAEANARIYRNHWLKGFTPLDLAAMSNNTEVVSLLLSKGADVNSRDEYGRTPQHFAAGAQFIGCGEGGWETISLLLSKGADVNEMDKDGRTPLHFAAIRGELKSASFLLSKGADVNAIDNKGRTPLHEAICSIKIVEILVESGADVNAILDNGWTPLHWAEVNLRTEVAEFLRKHGGVW